MLIPAVTLKNLLFGEKFNFDSVLSVSRSVARCGGVCVRVLGVLVGAGDERGGRARVTLTQSCATERRDRVAECFGYCVRVYDKLPEDFCVEWILRMWINYLQRQI